MHKCSSDGFRSLGGKKQAGQRPSSREWRCAIDLLSKEEDHSFIPVPASGKLGFGRLISTFPPICGLEQARDTR